MFSQLKTSCLLSSILNEIELRTGNKTNFSKMSQSIGVSRKRLTELVRPKQKGVYQEPSLSLISNVIDYFKMEGYALTYNDFVEENIIDESIEAKKKIDNSIVFTLNEYIEPMYEVGTKISIIKYFNTNNLNTILCINSQDRKYLIVKHKRIKNIDMYYHLTSGKEIKNIHLVILGKVSSVVLP